MRKGLLFPKVESPEQVREIEAVVDRTGGASLPLWVMIETPVGVLNVQAVAGASKRLRVLVMGTSDLVKELRATHIESRRNLDYALQHCVLCARVLDKDILDGVHLDFRNLESLLALCERGKAMGFDGKTLIHPTQIEVANNVFGYSDEDVTHAKAILDVWEAAIAEGKGVAVLDGQLIENLHAQEAERVLAFGQALATRTN